MWKIINDIFNYLTQCYRACIFQFQNGGKWHSGESIQRMSITHESKYYSLRSIKSKFQDVLISADEDPYFGDLLHYKIYSVGDVTKLPDSTYKNRLHSQNVVSQYYFLLEENKTNRPLGMLILTFPIIDGLNNIQLQEIKQISRQISSVLLP